MNNYYRDIVWFFFNRKWTFFFCFWNTAMFSYLCSKIGSEGHICCSLNWSFGALSLHFGTNHLKTLTCETTHTKSLKSYLCSWEANKRIITELIRINFHVKTSLRPALWKPKQCSQQNSSCRKWFKGKNKQFINVSARFLTHKKGAFSKSEVAYFKNRKIFLL